MLLSIATIVVFALLGLILASKEWRTHEMTSTSNASSDDVNEFRNTTEGKLFIRRVDLNSALTAQPSESVQRHQVSKSATFEQANAEIDQSVEIVVAGGSAGATSADAEQSAFANGSWLYPVGAFTLEPGEAVHQNFLKQSGTGGTARHNALIHFHF